MNTRWTLPIFAVSGGIAALLLRLLQNLTGFESSTGLPIPGNIAATVLPIALVILCVLLGVMAFMLLPKESPVFPFRADKRPLQWIPAAGAVILGLSGLIDVVQGVSGNSSGEFPMFEDEAELALWEVQNVGLSSGMQLISGLLTMLSALGLLWCIALCAGKRKGRGIGLLIAPVGMVVRLVGVYRMDSINPVLEAYAVELLALALLVLGFYSLSAFAFGAGTLRRFTFYAGMAIVFCLCSLADPVKSWSFPLMYLGGALTLLGFLLLALETPSAPPEMVPDAAQ